MNKQDLFKKRIGFKGDLKDISLAVCKEFDLGKFLSNKLVVMGYEDFNFSIKTTKGIFFVKVFSDFRKLADCKRYAGMIEEALAKGVHTPRLFKSKQGYLNFIKVNGKKLRLVVMEFVDGKTLYELNSKLSLNEIRFLAQQAARVNSMKVNTLFVYDHFAIVHFLKEFKKTQKFLSKEDLSLIRPLVKEFKEMKINELPHCFVHADIISTNIMKDKKGRLWIIDFAVANNYPRINELAVMACNPFFEPKSKKNTERNLGIAVREYQKLVPLTKKELEVLPVYVKLVHAMHVIAATYERYKKGNNSKENWYWYKQGKAGLLQSD
ncbi:Homoserine kinase [uncultured archaeon]|nr:Homoserine kinase [uncultured archaeon]